MNPAAIATLLQLVASMLTGVQNNAQASQITTQQTIAVASRAIQLSAQMEAMPRINFPIPLDGAIPPNITDLYNAPYLDVNGNYVPVKMPIDSAGDLSAGAGVALVAEDTSFGDLNGDGIDDAAAIVEKTDDSGNTTLALAAMLNQGGIMFNIADFPLGSPLKVYSHNVVQGGDIVLNMQVGTGAVQTSTYELLGDQLIKL